MILIVYERMYGTLVYYNIAMIVNRNVIAQRKIENKYEAKINTFFCVSSWWLNQNYQNDLISR